MPRHSAAGEIWCDAIPPAPAELASTDRSSGALRRRDRTAPTREWPALLGLPQELPHTGVPPT
jgi:hypothetical protein